MVHAAELVRRLLAQPSGLQVDARGARQLRRGPGQRLEAEAPVAAAELRVDGERERAEEREAAAAAAAKRPREGAAAQRAAAGLLAVERDGLRAGVARQRRAAPQRGARSVAERHRRAARTRVNEERGACAAGSRR